MNDNEIESGLSELACVYDEHSCQSVEIFRVNSHWELRVISACGESIASGSGHNLTQLMQSLKAPIKRWHANRIESL